MSELNEPHGKSETPESHVATRSEVPTPALDDFEATRAIDPHVEPDVETLAAEQESVRKQESN